jgi:twinkle protein
MATTDPPLSQDLLISGPLPARGIMAETCEKYSYYKATLRGKSIQVACYKDENNETTGQKIRGKNKDFFIMGKPPKVFFGQHLFSGGKKLIITEGEIDCLTVSQVQGNKWPVVSIPLGAGSAKKTFAANIDWLESFEQVITMFDMDKEGEKARKDVEGLLSPGKLYHATLPLKDPNEVLLKGNPQDIVSAIWNAKQYKPGGIVNGIELKQKIKDKKKNIVSLPWPWEGPLQDLTRGARLAEMVLVTAGTGIGKSTILRELGHYWGVEYVDPIKLGMIFLEEQNTTTAESLMSLHVNKRLHLEDAIPEDEWEKAFTETLGTERFIFYDHFGSLDGDSLIQKIRYMATVEGCRMILLDHISIAVSGLATNNERKDIDVLMTNLYSLTQELGIGIIVVCHLKKTEGKATAAEEGGKISLDDLRGSGTLKQIPDTIIAGERNQQDDDEKSRNLIRLRLLKCRFTGSTGLAGYLWFNKETGRLDPIADADTFLGEPGGDLKGDCEENPF